jgi:hypothetical protein
MSDVSVLKSRKFEQDGYTVIVEHISDDMQCKTPDELQANYEGSPLEEKLEYLERDRKRFDAWLEGEWQYIGIAVTIRKQTETNWADDGLEVGRSSVWGIESDSGHALIAEMEKEQIEEAFQELERLKKALCGEK